MSPPRAAADVPHLPLLPLSCSESRRNWGGDEKPRMARGGDKGKRRGRRRRVEGEGGEVKGRLDK
jgi:hypothetical protein